MNNKLYLVLKETFYVDGHGETVESGFEYSFSEHPVYEYFTGENFDFDYHTGMPEFTYDSFIKKCEKKKIPVDLKELNKAIQADGVNEGDGYSCCVYNFFAKEITPEQKKKYEKIISDYNNIFNL